MLLKNIGITYENETVLNKNKHKL